MTGFDISEASEKVGFWILGGVGTACVLLGWMMSRQQDWIALPLWQVLVLIAVVWIASIIFASD